LLNVKVPWNNRLGIIAQSEIKKRLSYFANVNEYNVDVGLDFYCELLENDSPKLPFYIQAKGTEHFDDNWGQSIPKSTIIYWLQQVFPVYLVVYDENDGNCYWLAIEDIRYDLLQKLSKPNSNSIYITVTKNNKLLTGKRQNESLVEKIKEDKNSIDRFLGFPPFKGEGYLKSLPEPPQSLSEYKRIKENTRANLYSMMQYHSSAGEDDEVYSYCEFLTKMDKSHYNHFVWFGILNKKKGNSNIAKEHFKKALEICKADKIWPEESMKNIIEYIKNEIDNCN